MAESASSSSSAVYPPQQNQEKYDVFLSFRGEDTRDKFTSHLYDALHHGKKIYTYMDLGLDKGDEIWPALVTAIRQSKLSIIIFSENYASSSWCLDELLYIIDCMRTNGQFVIPVFYDIDPSHVRKQEGSFAAAFAQHELRFKDKESKEKVNQWRAALEEVANLCGWDSTVTRYLILTIFPRNRK